jgi:hypothetical protein
MKAAKHVVAYSLIAISLSASFSFCYAADSAVQKGLDLLRNSKAAPTQAVTGALSNDDIVAGLKEALVVGSGKVIGQLGKADGFNNDAKVRIPLPAQLGKVKSALDKVGMAGSFADLETRMNRAAEAATPVAKELFMQSIKGMSLTDASGILRGGNDAATQYFRRTMSPELASKMQPIEQQALSKVGAVGMLDQVMTSYNALPLVPKQNINLNDYVVNKTMDGIFLYLAEQEAAIRKDPVARTTDLLKKVFGATR